MVASSARSASEESQAEWPAPAAGWTTADGLACALIVLGGIVQLCWCDRSPDFGADDVFYADCAASLLRGDGYGFMGVLEANQPPGLSLLLAAVCKVLGCSHIAFLRAMVVCETAGLVAAYALLRRLAPRAIAAGACLMLICSPFYFFLATQWVWPAFPFLLASMLALLGLHRLEVEQGARARLLWTLGCAAATVTALMLASVGIALLAAMVARVCVVALRDRRAAPALLRRFLPVLLLGALVQGAWMQGKPTIDWPEVPGYPRSYLQQLKVKSGNDPSLGIATARDIPVRVGKNLFGRSRYLGEVLTARWMLDSWPSFFVLAPLLLVAAGWFVSLRGGGGLVEWYFAAHELVYLLWPWKTELRFVVTTMPLALLFLYRGVRGVWRFACLRPRFCGALVLPCAMALLAVSLRDVGTPENAGGTLHLITSVTMWAACACVSTWMAWTDRFPLAQAAEVRALRATAFAATAYVFLSAARTDVAIARENDKPDPAPPDVQAALWIRDRTPPDAVVMARHVPTVFHFSGHKVVWFPPISDPATLMRGILRLGVSYVIVADRFHYYLPADRESFAALQRTYPSSFQVELETPQMAIYQVRRPRSGRHDALRGGVRSASG